MQKEREQERRNREIVIQNIRQRNAKVQEQITKEIVRRDMIDEYLRSECGRDPRWFPEMEKLTLQQLVERIIKKLDHDCLKYRELVGHFDSWKIPGFPQLHKINRVPGAWKKVECEVKECELCDTNRLVDVTGTGVDQIEEELCDTAHLVDVTGPGVDQIEGL
jgi:hypothetical protein